jgi:hypothetical protein
MSKTYEVTGSDYNDSSQVPKDKGLYYRCLRCGDVMPSVPNDNIACKCSNIYIDVDMWRLDIADFSKMEVVKIIL